MILHGIAPPYRTLPESLRERSSYSLQNVPSQNFRELHATERHIKKTLEQQRPKLVHTAGFWYNWCSGCCC